MPSVESIAAHSNTGNASDTIPTREDSQSGLRTGSDRAGQPIVAWNTNAACPPMRRADRVNLHGMHTSPSRLQSARARSGATESSSRDLPVRPVTQGGATVVGKGLGMPTALFACDSTVAARVPGALPSMQPVRTPKVAALAATVEDEGLSAWASMQDQWEEHAEHNTDLGAPRPNASTTPNSNTHGGKSPRSPRSQAKGTALLQGREGIGGASHRMVVGAAASAAKKRRDSAA